MRALDIFMVVLIAAGTWSPAMTRDLSTFEKKLLHELQEIWSHHNSSSASGWNTLFAGIGRRVAEECQTNGGPNAYDDLVKGAKNLESCTQLNLDVQHIDDEIASAQSNSNWKPVFNKYCPKFSVLVECSKHFTDSLKPCLEPEEKDSVNALQDVVHLILEVLCHDGGDAIASFLSNEGLKCYISNLESLKPCRLEVDNDLHFDEIFRNNITSSTTGKPILNLDQEACKSIDKWQTCFVEVFRGCENPKSADALDDMFTAFEKLTTCENSAASSDGSANSSVISLVSGLLITTAMTMYLRFLIFIQI